MTIPLKVIDPAHLLTDQLAEHIQDRTEKFGDFFERVKACRVTVDPPARDVAQGRFRVRIVLTVPNSKIAVDRQTGADLPMAIRESFDAAEQRLQDHARISRDAVAGGSRRSKRPR